MPQDDERKVVRVTEIDTERLSKLEIAVDNLRTDGISRQHQMTEITKSNERLEHAVFGNGKEGLQKTVMRMELKMDTIYTFIEELPEMLEEKIDLAITRFGMQVNTGKMKTIAREEADRKVKETETAPGSWGEFRKSWLFPVLLAILCTLAGGWAARAFLP